MLAENYDLWQKWMIVGERKKPGEIYIRTAFLGSGYNEIAKVPPRSQIVDGEGYGTEHSYLIDLT